VSLALIPMERYPRRPLRRAGESLAGYCWHVYAANGHAPVPAGHTALQAAAALLGQPVAATAAAFEEGLFQWRAHSRQPVWHRRAQAHRFCPRCVAEDGFHAVLWDMPLMTACEVHGCRLVDRCHGCRQPLAWGRLKEGFICDCGAALSEGPSQEACPSAVLLARHLASTVACLANGAEIGPPSTSHYLYEALDWVQRARNMLTYHRDRSWPHTEARPARSRLVPGSSAIRFTTGMPRTVRRATSRLLRRCAAGRGELLVELESHPTLARLARLRTELRESANSMMRSIEFTIAAVMDEHSAGIGALPPGMRNPSCSSDEFAACRDAFAHWWTALLPRFRIASAQLTVHPPAETASIRDQIALLNVLLAAARTGAHPDAFELLTTRWQVPPELAATHGDLDQVAGRLAQLHAAEHAFVAALAREGLKRASVMLEPARQR
jgi:hypothetical protein